MAFENPNTDDGPAPDPFEAELVAYLDGELDEPAARKVAARLAADPEARVRAAALKKSFDLLDYLPKPEPSANFTTRTLELIPAAKSRGSQPANPTPSRGARSKVGSSSNVSTSMPIVLPEDDVPGLIRRPRPLLWAAGIAAAVMVFGVLGYFATAAARPFLSASHNKDEDAKNDTDTRVIENLPLFAVADDIAFVQELAKPELFGDDPAVAYDVSLKIPHGDTADKPTGKQFEALARSFRALPLARQAEIVKLDQELYAKEPRERDRLFRALEAFAVWLDRLPDADRRGVLGAATPHLRREVVRDLREQQWLDALPTALRKKVDSLINANEKAELIKQWKDDEAVRRERLAFVRQHAEAFAANKSPWPFDTEVGRKEVTEFAQSVFRVDDVKRCRLSLEQLAEYRRTLELARRDGTWAWYGLTVYELSRLHPYLPEPAEAKLMITEPNDLPELYARAAAKKGGASRLKPNTFGKWPEFPLEVLKDVPLGKFVPPNMPQLGPARLGDFKEPVRTFVTKELFPKLTGEEQRALRFVEGKWPDYSRELVRYATKYDLSMPGVMLPGSPKKWDATYGAPAIARPSH
ncbi:Uncharacterized protein OS=Blastopirellula marina DSM 3645 GN=DSM3645_08206 PE=4 SV=1 [Gemmata massiliana]|uniref:Uncharacterized protein n=1 Tax=Gemmata massiliana TaxID=1210884 RepID=A0A6P2CZM3_9BACT|nr:hypothetical protein [Gemmata massiliana]VTR94588.1 Uncharacterized protein OS=Blastopirellula marina DSM 3645 GN=DSM3645_08206 PE=4 SV=1 [Gemmata massiliana]